MRKHPDLFEDMRDHDFDYTLSGQNQGLDCQFSDALAPRTAHVHWPHVKHYDGWLYSVGWDRRRRLPPGLRHLTAGVDQPLRKGIDDREPN